MPLIEKKIMVEGDYGQTIVRTYYENVKPKNPYANPGGTKLDRQVKKFRKGREKTWGNAGLGTSRPEKGYTWSMGYNHCSGRYTGGMKYSRFSGSSLNRSPQLKLYDNNSALTKIDPSDIQDGAGDSFEMALKTARSYRRRRMAVPEEVRNYLMQRDPESEGKFKSWLSTSQGGPSASIFLPIHELSARSRGKIKDKATAFFRASPGNRVFCTLTFVAPVDDRTGVAILNKFLTSARKSFPKLQYFWVAERQDNGNIHFHAILNQRLPVRRWNALWVLANYNSGLVGCDKFGDRVSKEEIMMRFKNDTIHKVFNPLDIKKIKSIGALSGYLTKYITKQKQTPFACLPWHCSRRVSRMFTRATVSPSAFSYMKSFANYRVDKTTGECLPPLMAKPHAFYVVVYAANKAAPLKFLKEMEQINKWILEGHELDRLCMVDDDIYRKLICKT